MKLYLSFLLLIATISADGDLSGKLDQHNTEIHALTTRLEERYSEAQKLLSGQADEGDYEALLIEINELKGTIKNLENEWRESCSKESKEDDSQFSFWDQEETTIGQLVMHYGSSDYLYIVPPDVSGIKINLHSSLPIPRESWTQLLEVVLAQNGVGVKSLNTYARALYIMKQDLSAASTILTDEKSLRQVPQNERIIYIFSPSPERIKGVTQFFERFRDPKRSFIYQVGYKIAIIATQEEVGKLLTLYKAVWEEENQKVTKVLSVTRLGVKDMEKVLSAYFSQSNRVGRIAMMKGEGDDLTIIPLTHEGSLVLIGAKEMVEKAEKIIGQTEEQILDPCEMSVYTYTCRHGDPVEISEVLEKVYASLIYSEVEGTETVQYTAPSGGMPPQMRMPNHQHAENGEVPPPPMHQPFQSVVTTTQKLPSKEAAPKVNFIPYINSGSIMMVVRRDALDKIKEILKKLDVPKKMVKIEVLLFEKKTKSSQSSGINLLRLGTSDDRKKKKSLSVSDEKKGILQFLYSRTKRNVASVPGFDIAYNFLMSQEGVRINASPSVTTMNQVQGQIKLVEERSINEGTVRAADSKEYEQKFSRAQYGTTINITPTIHEPEFGLDEEVRFVTLETDITFETVSSDADERPNVVRRHVENQVRIKDGETLIIGGLKRKTGEEGSDKIPFLGDIPGLGKLFGSSKSMDEETEMFIFITPKIILDTEGQFDRLRQEELTKRPGDVPEFLQRVQEAKKATMGELFADSLKLLFGNEK